MKLLALSGASIGTDVIGVTLKAHHVVASAINFASHLGKDLPHTDQVGIASYECPATETFPRSKKSRGVHRV